MMNKKTRDMLIFLILYVLACTVGVAVFSLVSSLPDIYRFLLADVASTLVIYLCSMLFKNASLYDPYWSVIPPFMVGFAMIYYQAFGLANILLLIALSVWGIRLTYNWASLWTGFHDMDWRYVEMKRKAPKLYPLTNLFGIQMFPTAIVFAQLACALMMIKINPQANFLTFLGAAIIGISALIQLIADQQMKRFKARTHGEKKCIEEGLWKYSRHPNYFGEIMVWWGVYVMYLDAVETLDFMIISPILMTSLFLLISIPWMERKILQTRPEYMDYQKRVSMIIPFFRKERDEDRLLDRA